MAKNRIVVKKVDGITYELHLNQLIDSSIYWHGCFEGDTSKAIQELVKPGMVVLDIGANIGCHALPMAKIVGTTGKVIAFEPMEWPLERLRRNIALNSFNNIVIENIGVSNISEVKDVLFRSSWTIDNTLIEEANKSSKVQFVRLDDYVKEVHLERVDFIKLDVDGYEYKVISGALETLRKFKPDIIMELGDYSLRLVGDSIEELMTEIYSLGYEFCSEKDFKPFPDRQSIIQSIPDLDTTTINVVLLHQNRRDAISHNTGFA